MDLNTIWYVLITVLFIGYFTLEGFDFGVGMLLPLLGKNDTERRVIINAIGPHWDGNEVWLITAGGAIFAAFPYWYATLFSGFYLPLFLMLVALIFRGVAFEFRSKDQNPTWRSFWDWSISIGSLVPALLWGVAFTNFIKGVQLDVNMNFTGGFWSLLNPYALLGGLVAVSGFILHGALFLGLKTEGDLAIIARRTARWIWLPVVVLAGGFFAATFFNSDIFTKPLSIILAVAALLTLIISGWFIRQQKDGWAFGFTALVIIFATASLCSGLYPRVLIAQTPELSLTVYNSSSSPYTLQIMTYVALVGVPLVLLYQGWSYWIFRKRIMTKPSSLEY
jgi:cytochrome bd ubiquinol oxidase subunit II